MSDRRRSSAGLITALLAATAGIANAQQPGTVTPEVHPKLPTWKCTDAGGCTQQDTSVVLEWDFRWIHTQSYDNCVTNSGIKKDICPDEATCAEECVVEGVDYRTSGVTTSDDTLTMNQYVPGDDGSPQNFSPRSYLLGPDGNYVLVKLLGQELSFEVDLSTLPCGENGALYLSEMHATGGRNEYNTGGANYGSGYCDAQCPIRTWLNGTLNTEQRGACCNEMDILEANAFASSFTPHPCINGKCDPIGCSYNTYAKGFQSFYGPGKTLDTTKPFKVVTQFITNDGTKTGTLVKINRYYVQNGVKIPGAAPGGDQLDSSNCGGSTATTYGGLAAMGQALGRGMVLTFSIWNSDGDNMNWLDSGSAGPCSATEGAPSNIVANHADAHISFSNIRWGDIGSTDDGGDSGVVVDEQVKSSSTSVRYQPARTTMPSTSTSTSVKPTTTANPTSTTAKEVKTTTTTAAAPAGPQQTRWGQCGGQKWRGATTCASPWTCQYQNDYYSQCL